MFLAATGLCGLVVAAALLYCLYQHVRVSSAIAAIRKRGEPVTPDEFAPPPRVTPSRFAENVASFHAVTGHAWVDILSVGAVDGFLAAPDSSRLDAETVAALKDLRACLDEAAKASGDPDEFELSPLTGSIADGDEPSDCERRAHHVRRLCLEPAIDAATRLCLGDPEDFAAIVGEWLRDDRAKEPWPNDHTEPVGLAVRYLAGSAVDHAVEARNEEAVSRLRAAFQGVKTVEGGPWLPKFSEWQWSELEVLVALRAMLQRIPAGLDLRDFEADLDPKAPNRNLLQSLRGDRAFMNRMYARLDSEHGGSGGARLPWWPLASLARSAFFHRDQAIYLDRMQKLIEGSESAYWTWQRTEARNPKPSHPDLSAPFSAAFTLIVPDLIEASAEVEAEILLARAALAAYRDGADAGASVANASTDPFSGQPIHARVDSNGTLVLWSVGTNLVDDGGAARDKDLVWRIPKR